MKIQSKWKTVAEIVGAIATVAIAVVAILSLIKDDRDIMEPAAKKIAKELAREMQPGKDDEHDDLADTRLLISRLGMLLREPLTEVARKHTMKKGDAIFVQRILDPRRWGSELGDTIRGVLQNQLSSPDIGLRLEMVELFRANYALQGILMDTGPGEQELQLAFLRRNGFTWETLETTSILLSGIRAKGNSTRTYRMVCATDLHSIKCQRNDDPINENNCQIWEALKFARIKAEAGISEQDGITSNRRAQQFDLQRERINKDIIEKEGRGTLTGIEDGDLPRIIGRSVQVQRCAKVIKTASSSQ
uniref:Uncharacterized protein n=1 Tax=Candidatus Kentrum sp. MB TaxID=2138164 RepID=A0A450XIA8_9GAMM|nr:MAG: hypothetical protein BECKMB1821I_GA0114274_10088 [Candidatus Kentron sp. MB]VFK31479.1 MAG: hypothetical protein BECKMB1821G_GA0114241_10857 [Candidatus Kentron sp. MB]VFK74649.1 MAG: hypothetical protein BECKMB1821H_GA0114242_10088 [Candidatus Kentron sp. MB]